jgi:hypothetical protein
MKIKSLASILSPLLLVTALHATPTKMNVSVGVASVDVGEKSGTGYDVGFGYGKYYDGGMYWGGEFILEYADLNVNVIGYAADIRLGYTPVNTFLKNFTLYGIGAAMYQSVDDRENSGFGYGAGLEYRITNAIGVNVDYKTFNMTPSNIGFLDYDYTKIGASVKYMF